MIEEVFRYGESDLGFGMLSIPESPDGAPMAVCLNAGLIQREGPYRMNVLLCRVLSDEGYIALRVDLAGKGDSPSREGLSNRESVAMDWQFIKQSLFDRFGPRKIVIIGLCSGADNAIKIAAEDSDACGMVLLDPISPLDKGFRKRDLMIKLGSFRKWITLPWRVFNHLRGSGAPGGHLEQGVISLRDPPNDDDLKRCFENIVRGQGRVLAVFTGHATSYYNQVGQFARALDIDGVDSCCREIFWPLADHLYTVQHYRDRLVRTVADWAASNRQALLRDDENMDREVAGRAPELAGRTAKVST